LWPICFHARTCDQQKENDHSGRTGKNKRINMHAKEDINDGEKKNAN
jgi:hypothetical protein